MCASQAYSSQTRGTDCGSGNKKAVSGPAGTYRRTRTSFACACICEASYQAYIRSNMSMLTSKAFSMRSAISGDSTPHSATAPIRRSGTSIPNPAERFQYFLPTPQMLDHGSPVTIRPVALQVADNDPHVSSRTVQTTTDFLQIALGKWM